MGMRTDGKAGRHKGTEARRGWNRALRRMASCLRAFVPTCLLLSPGCGRGHAALWSQANPQTEVSVNPLTKTITLFNNKDVNLSFEEFSGTTADGATWAVKGLSIVDQSSPVRAANAGQLELAERITRAAFEGFGESLGRIIAEAMAPLRGATASLETPVGVGNVTTGGAAMRAADGG